jgi:hypothetical protein
VGAAAHHRADVSGRKGQIAPVTAAYAIDQAQARTRMHHVVILGNHVEQRTLDLSDLDLAPADYELAAS